MRVPLAYIRQHRPAIEAAVLSAGRLDGEAVEIDARVWYQIIADQRCAEKHPGLGDAVAAIAQPIARGLDAVLGTKIQECGGCKRRREALNRLVPRL
jgi:hypothetical protein